MIPESYNRIQRRDIVMTDKLKVIKDLIEKKEWEALEKYVDFGKLK